MTEQNQSAQSAELHKAIKAVRFALVLVLVAASYPAVRLSLGISKFRMIFADMLGEGAQLPTITRGVIASEPVLIALSVAIPLVGIALLFVRNVTRSLYVLGGLFLLLVPTCIVVSTALFMPLVDIIEKMQQ